MSNFDYDKLLEEEFGGDPKKVLENYRYESDKSITERVKSFVESCQEKSNDEKEFLAIINLIVLWKINRMPKFDNEQAVLEKLVELSEIHEPRDAIESYCDTVRDALKALLKAKGFRLPMASTVLHFFNPEVFPIFDQRAYRVIFKNDYKVSSSVKKNADLYINYLTNCIIYHQEKLNEELPFSVIDKYLYQIDREIGNTVNA